MDALRLIRIRGIRRENCEAAIFRQGTRFGVDDVELLSGLVVHVVHAGVLELVEVGDVERSIGRAAGDDHRGAEEGEGVGDLAATAVILAIILAAPKFRNPALWWVMLITMFGIYAPFWIGTPFNSDLSAPHMKAEIAHLKMAVPAVIGCFLARRHYFEAQ